MSWSFPRRAGAICAAAAMLAAAGCGSGGDDSSSDSNGNGGGSSAATEDVTAKLFEGSAADNVKDPAQGKKGGKITMLAAADVDYMDPGKSYYSFANAIITAAHRRLYSYPPGGKVTPDIADGEAEISDDKKTVTIKLKKGVKFSKPVNREVTSKDFKYAIERAFSENVSNGYVTTYMADIVGAPKEIGKFKTIEGIETPDDYTLVFKLKKGLAAPLIGALSMVVSSPVPPEYAKKFDQENPSTYGEGHAVYTGPYMVKSDAAGKAVGYKPGRRIQLVRNPEYSNVGDYRPAYADEWDIREGNEDDVAATRRILNGESMITGDFRPPANQLEKLLDTQKKNLSAVPSGGWRYIAMDTSRPPFDDLNVRKAVVAGFDRNSARQQRGGEAVGPIAEHYIPPGMVGFEESGGVEGKGDLDFMKDPAGDADLAAKYFKEAGMESGKYEGNETVLIVGDNGEPDNAIAQITEQQLKQLGFKTKLRLVTRDTMYTKFCQVPAQDVNVCPSLGWIKDFDDPQTMLDKPFNGQTILKTNNVNSSELNVPEINEAIDKARPITDEAERAQAWADVNEQIVAQAPAVPIMWDYQTAAKSSNVRGVQSLETTVWDLNFTSLTD